VATRIADVQLRAAAQMRCSETLLLSLVRASPRQWFGDPAHPSPRARQGVGPANLKQLNTIVESSKERKQGENGEKYFLLSYYGDPQSLL
jgi:hypothetical protein